jgi:hypothetical protein
MLGLSNNPALRTFIQMRQGLAKKEEKVSAPVPSMTSLPKPEKHITLKYIIDEKPADKEVREYLKQRIEELASED